MADEVERGPVEVPQNEGQSELAGEGLENRGGGRDLFSTLFWAGVLIWAGLVFLAQNLGLLARLRLPAQLDAGSLVLGGIGALLLAQVGARLALPGARRPIVGRLILGLVLIGASLGDLLRWGVIWPLLIIAFGVGMIVRALSGR